MQPVSALPSPYVFGEIRRYMKGVAVSDKQMFKLQSYKRERKTGRNEIWNDTCKQEEPIAYYVRYKGKNKNFANENDKISTCFS
jgi:hypothetical protein